MKQSGNFAFATMLQSVAWLSFSFFSGSVKIEFTVLVEGFIHMPPAPSPHGQVRFLA